jgi:hypothetical protein
MSLPTLLCRSALLFSALVLAPRISAAVDRADIATRLESLPAGHPRLFLSRDGEVALKQRIASDPFLQSVQRSIVAEADPAASVPVERVQVGG